MANRGMALITALVTALVMLSLAVSFLYFLERDYRFAGHQEQSQEAYYLAVAGLRFQASRTDLLGPGSSKTTLAIPSNSQTHFVDISVSASGLVTSRGYVMNIVNGFIEAERVLTVAPNSPIRSYQDQSL
jgi:Tfp pilus assembly protein PilX